MLETFQVLTNKREGGYEVTFILIIGSSNISMVSRRSCDLCHMTSLPACRKWDMGHAGNGTCQTLAPIRLSVFRDRILEPRYCDPYL